MATKNVLSLFETRSDLKIDEARLSAPVLKKMGELDTMLMILDRLKNDLAVLGKTKRVYRQLSLISIAPAILGLILGVVGLVEGILGFLQVAVSLGAAVALFGVVYVVNGYQKTAQAAILQKSKQVETLKVDLEVRLDHVYDEVLAELYPVPRPSSFGARSTAARHRARRGEDSR